MYRLPAALAAAFAILRHALIIGPSLRIADLGAIAVDFALMTGLGCLVLLLARREASSRCARYRAECDWLRGLLAKRPAFDPRRPDEAL